jgi:nitrogen fixation NifU-like protein
MPRFSQVLLEHAQDPCNQGAMKDADLVGRASINGNPPFISIFLAMSGNNVKRATFESHGCGVTTAICSVTTEFIVGKTIQECNMCGTPRSSTG